MCVKNRVVGVFCDAKKSVSAEFLKTGFFKTPFITIITQLLFPFEQKLRVHITQQGWRCVYLPGFKTGSKKKKWDFGEKPGLKKKKNGICQFWEKIDFFWYLTRASESDQKWPHEQSDPVTARTRLN